MMFYDDNKYGINDFNEIISIVNNDIENIIYVINVLKKSDSNTREKYIIESYIKFLSMVLDYNSLFERALVTKFDDEERS